MIKNMSLIGAIFLSSLLIGCSVQKTDEKNDSISKKEFVMHTANSTPENEKCVKITQEIESFDSFVFENGQRMELPKTKQSFLSVKCSPNAVPYTENY